MQFFGIEWDNDLVIPNKLHAFLTGGLKFDISNVIDDYNNIIHITSNLLRILYSLSVLKGENDIQLKKMRKKKTEYYSFEIPRSLTALQLKTCVENDNDIIDLEFISETINAKINYFESMLAQYKYKKRDIKTILDWEMYIQGQK